MVASRSGDVKASSPGLCSIHARAFPQSVSLPSRDPSLGDGRHRYAVTRDPGG
jgi:hypothetical protein